MTRIKAYILTCEARRDCLVKTLTSLRSTDWGEEPTVIVDRINQQDRRASQTANALALLEGALQDEGDFTLFLEDDLEFNRHIRHNLLCWPPVRMGFLLCGSLYNPGITGFAGSGRAVCESANYFLYDTNDHYGSQALLLRRSLLQECVEHWDEIPGMQDIKISRITGRFCHLMFCHLPSLVQHAAVPSTWGGHSHRTNEFDPDFRSTARGG